MIFGDCPYEDCDGSHALSVPDWDVYPTPFFGKETCEKCKRQYWLYYSRAVPESYTPEDFAKRFKLDEETKTISPR